VLVLVLVLVLAAASCRWRSISFVIVETTRTRVALPWTIAFGDVEGDRGCGLVEVLQYVRAPTARPHFVENRVDPCAKSFREPISVELLMIEHAAFIGRGCGFEHEHE
jgi:hypothetical protein